MGREEENGVIGAICLNGERREGQRSFEELLLDETLAKGDIWIRREALQRVGGINYRLGAKRNYELLLRIAKAYKVCLSGSISVSETDRWICLEPEEQMISGSRAMWEKESLKTDCYLIGRYKTELLSMGCFDDAVLGILSACQEEITQYLERMIAQTEEYYKIYDCTQPILIYRGNDVCYGILDTFARYMGQALEEWGQHVEYFDTSTQQITELEDYVRCRFKAVIGMQTYMFSVKRGNGNFVHDEIVAPKYQFWFDHPIRGREHLQNVPHRLCILTPDGNYARFIQNFYGHSARFLPPAGTEKLSGNGQRDYAVVFLGSYYDGPIEDLRTAGSMDKRRGYLLNRYLLYMRRDLRMTPEDALKKTLDYYGVSYTQEQFMEIMYRERWVTYCLSYYYRNKAIGLLLEEGITLHVFGNTWKESPFWGHSGLIYHEAVAEDAALEVYARAKLSLNITTWHKDGFTERIANAMLQKSVVVTDRTTYLEEHFTDGRDLLLFDLGRLEELPGRIKELLSNEEKRKQIAENGYEKAVKQHTWNQRAGKILEFIEEDRN